MEQTPHKYVTVAYELYADNEKGIHELIEKAPVEHPFQFISGMGVALDTFEDKILALTQGADFDFTLKQDGKFDKDMVYPGAVLPLVNADGNRFQGLVLEVKDNVVVIDLNHPLAGKDLHFKGQVVTMRDATDDELKELIKMMSGEGGCNCEGGCEGGCHHGEGEGCCGGHHHGEGEGCCHKH